MLILGDWVDKFTFATFDGEQLVLQRYLEGETRP
jgi:UDP-2,3-diacylglucosamine hydrolase